jgi:hypothetical protein
MKLALAGLVASFVSVRRIHSCRPFCRSLQRQIAEVKEMIEELTKGENDDNISDDEEAK